MLNNSDRALLLTLQSQNPDFACIIDKLNAEHQELLSKISHEIRNPLTLIDSSLQLIEKEHPEAVNFRFWEQVKEDLQYLRLLLDDLTQFNNAAVLNCQPTDLSTLARTVVHSFTPEFQRRGLLLQFYPCEKLPVLSVDSLKLKELLVNLLKNAMEATEPGGCASVRLSSDTRHVQLSVEDTGCGIPKSLHEEIFLPFRTFKPQGTGLGLSVSRQIAIAHGGTLTLYSKEGSGSTFTLTLPKEPLIH